MSEAPVVSQPLSAVVAALSARADSLGGEVASARGRSVPTSDRPRDSEQVKTTVDGISASRGSLGAPHAEVMALRADAAFRAVERAVQAARDALSGEPPSSLPDDPSEMEGTEVAQALLIDDLLATYDEERDEKGHLPRSASEAYARWATRREELDPVVRQHLTDLGSALETAADAAASYLLPPEPKVAPQQRRRGAWR